MIASATEIICELGLGESLVARSHECDFPPSILNFPSCTKARLDPSRTSREINDQVHDVLKNALAVYEVKLDVLKEVNWLGPSWQLRLTTWSKVETIMSIRTEPWYLRKRITSSVARAAKTIASTARIKRTKHDWYQYDCTGWRKRDSRVFSTSVPKDTVTRRISRVHVQSAVLHSPRKNHRWSFWFKALIIRHG